MLKAFEEHIKTEFPTLYQGRFLLACSGGVDSVVLTHLCARSQLDFALVHCNFKLRGEESDDDEVFVKKLAKTLQREFFVKHFDTDGYVSKNKVSIQMAARQLRYAWFDELVEAEDYKRVVTAHQLDDKLETFLINLSRGTGIDGLLGIPERTDRVLRPLLQFSRAQVLAYAELEGITWREDRSNLDTKYLRNQIRHQIVPQLKELHPTFLENFHKTQEFLQQTASIAENHVEEVRQRLFQESNGVHKISIDALLALRPTTAYLYALFGIFGFREWNDVEGLLSATSGKEVRSKSYRLVKHRKHLLLQAIGTGEDQVYTISEDQTRINEPLSLVIAQADTLGNTSRQILYVDKETLKYPLTVRKWKKGDYFYPLGMKGRKKMSKFFKDEKMDIISKEEQWLLCSGTDVVWVIGKRADERFKVSSRTKQILKFSVQE